MSDLKDVTEEIVGTARDAAYVAVGLGVLAIQRAQVRRNELKKALSGREDLLKNVPNPASELSKLVAGGREEWAKTLSGLSRGDLEERLSGLREELSRGVKFLDGHVEQLLETIDEAISPVEERLPDPARDIMRQARAQAHDVRKQIVQRFAA